MPGTPGSRTDLPPTKTVTIYRNGDAFWPGRKVVVNPRQVSTFDTFLATLTKRIEAPFGAVRRLYTPTQGRRVRHLDELKHGSAYVAAGNEPFKTLDYYGITTLKPQNKREEQIQPVAHSRIVASARWRKIIDGTCTINVFTNGKLLVAPVRVRIPKHTLKSWENVLAMVTEKVGLRTGAVFRLCKLDGQPVCGSAELENNQHYVAVGAEKFKPLPYDRSVPCRDLVKENTTESDQDILPDNERTKLEEDAVCFEEDLEHTARGQKKEHITKTERLEQQRQVSKIAALFTAGASSVFNAQNKRSETAGAAEVQEDRQLKVDLPIDQVEASIVEEEQEDVDWDEVFQDDMEATSPQQSLTAVSRKAEDKEREALHGLAGIRSRMSRFFKVKIKI
ncbi:doublecortin domain-containing protein 2 isoform X2 [Kryptolebias marmoratus]|uniref:doublecortin domain-containing protein 2 isoform X2 n=1 Tax=Kryptolebias marmoratus TaxID=37003 RepID=UPI0018ACF8A4|nr:doublecortin domain-containing protein 2 isoform X2 [Kryptolebias marmoratus]XP_037833554.1 doublecortin domain-containing protein 2 isoform X2 [Kryptolebias marmoratus]